MLREFFNFKLLSLLESFESPLKVLDSSKNTLSIGLHVRPEFLYGVACRDFVDFWREGSVSPKSDIAIEKRSRSWVYFGPKGPKTQNGF